jgi:HTH-type transcriptional regulator / antitoxin HipB
MYYRVGNETHLRNYLKALRQRNGLSQAQVAEQLGVTQQTYQRHEAQPLKMSSERLLTILAILNTDLLVRFKAE